MTNDSKPLALYIHWPFCKAKCPYCDFNSHVREGVDHGRWRAAMLAELEHMKGLCADGHSLTSIFFGGGTPSLMEAETVKALIDRAKALFPHDAAQLEVTLEANPTSVEAAKFAAFAKAGVNRVSLGVQSLNAESLAFLGREHSADEALAAVKLARDIFPCYSFDMIYALPNQTPDGWEAELRQALAFTRGHMSLYQLTIEENTAFHHAYHVKKSFALPIDEHAARMYEVTQSVMESAGMPAYETSNHAAVGQESRHNLSYWRAEAYMGVGAGAHGRLPVITQETPQHVRGDKIERIATATRKSPERWLEQAERDGHGLEVYDPLDAQAMFEEKLMMGLRLREGILLERSAFALLPQATLDQLEGLGMLTITPDRAATRLITTPKGALVLNHMLGMLLT